LGDNLTRLQTATCEQLESWAENYRLFDRYACPIASLAVLADDDGSPVSDTAKGGDMVLLVLSRKIDLTPKLWVSWSGCASSSASARSTL